MDQYRIVKKSDWTMIFFVIEKSTDGGKEWTLLNNVAHVTYEHAQEYLTKFLNK